MQSMENKLGVAYLVKFFAVVSDQMMIMQELVENSINMRYGVLRVISFQNEVDNSNHRVDCPPAGNSSILNMHYLYVNLFSR